MRNHSCLLEIQGKGLSEHAGVRQEQQLFLVPAHRAQKEISWMHGRRQIEVINEQAAQLTIQPKKLQLAASPGPYFDKVRLRRLAVIGLEARLDMMSAANL